MGTFFVNQKLVNAVNIVVLTSSGHLLTMINVSHVRYGAIFVDAMAMAVLNSSFLISLLKIFSISEQSGGLLGTYDMPYQLISSALLGILLEI